MTAGDVAVWQEAGFRASGTLARDSAGKCLADAAAADAVCLPLHIMINLRIPGATFLELHEGRRRQRRLLYRLPSPSRFPRLP